MPKVMTIGAIKDALPAGSYQGQVGQLRSLGAVRTDSESERKRRAKAQKLIRLWAGEVRAGRAQAPRLTPAQSAQMLRNIEAQIARDEEARRGGMGGLGYACETYGEVKRTRTVWKCPGGKKYSRAKTREKCKKVTKYTTELVCMKYDADLVSAGITPAHKRVGECKRPRRKLLKSRR